MYGLKEEQSFWREVMQRIEAGESKSSIAAALGLTRGQLRYRLRKYLAQPQPSLDAAAVGREQEPALTLDNSLFDESWRRTWQINRIVLMVREPTSLFTYWEVNDVRKQLICEHFQGAWRDLPFFLQLYDVTLIDFNGYNAHSVRRIQVDPWADNWYIHQVEPGRRYLVDFGTTTLQGGFFTILRSNIVETPPLKPQRPVQPVVRFAPVANTLRQGVCGEHEKKTNNRQEAWQALFDGYTLAEGEGGER